MFGWLFGKKKKVNGLNASKSSLLKEEIDMMTHRKRVRTLRRLRKTHTYDSSIDFMYADDMVDDFIMLYLLMDMVDVVSEEEAGFYEVEDAMVEAEVSPEGVVGEEIVSDLEETPEVESTDDIVAEEREELEEAEIEELEDVEPTPIAVEETVVEVAPVVEETVVVIETPSFEEKTETFADDFKVKDTSNSFGSDYGSDSGSSCDSYDSGDCGGCDD